MPTTTYDTSCTCSCASDANQAYHRQAPDLNKALFKFSTSSMTRISAEIAQAWNNEPEQVKRDYEVQALRERQALELKTFPDYRYTKSSGAGAGSGPAGTHAEALTLALGSLSVKGGSGGGG
ncbi:hypothetical protein EC991_003446 [Linnemannia zychae]|nr:hypothetical protein EC991_003446 [Linnemannia zychae]